MFPTKSMFDYISEINRLFPEAGENDSPELPMLSSYQTNFHRTSSHNLTPQHHMTGNQSSSSADSSLSPEYPDPYFRLNTPFQRRQRPIVGRKIFEKPEQYSVDQFGSPSRPISSSIDSGFDSSPAKPRRLPEDTYMSPNSNCGGRRPHQNVYELFPERNRSCFNTPLKTPPMSHGMSAASNFSPPSPMYDEPLKRLLSQPPTMLKRAPTQYNNMIKTPPTGSSFPSSSMQGGGSAMCTFCRKNGETPVVYMTHTVRTRVGNKSIVTCPILRSHVCSICGESGDNAHTITYCPVMRSNNNGLPLQSTTITLKNTRVKSNGRRRF